MMPTHTQTESRPVIPIKLYPTKCNISIGKKHTRFPELRNSNWEILLDGVVCPSVGTHLPIFLSL